MYTLLRSSKSFLNYNFENNVRAPTQSTSKHNIYDIM